MQNEKGPHVRSQLSFLTRDIHPFALFLHQASFRSTKADRGPSLSYRRTRRSQVQAWVVSSTAWATTQSAAASVRK